MTKKTNYAEDFPNEFEQGRRARLASVNKLDAPYDADTDTLKAWQAGYDAAEGEAARNETMAPDDEPKAEGQTSTATKSR